MKIHVLNWPKLDIETDFLKCYICLLEIIVEKTHIHVPENKLQENIIKVKPIHDTKPWVIRR